MKKGIAQNMLWVIMAIAIIVAFGILIYLMANGWTLDTSDIMQNIINIARNASIESPI